MDPFAERIALVTGGGSGIGRALCEALADRGAVVVVADIDVDRAGEVADGIVALGGQAEATCLDVTDAEAVSFLVEQLVAGHGRLDLLFNNAGIAAAGEVRDLTLSDWRHVLNVDLMGAIHCATAAYEQMVRQGSGHIVNVASASGLVAFPASAPYTTAKHAIVGFSGALRAEGAGLGVRVTTVCPGYVQTRLFEGGRFAKVDRDALVESIPVKPMTAEDAARRILKAVQRNRGLVTFPFSARAMWWMQRLHPATLHRVHRRAVTRFREKCRRP